MSALFCGLLPIGCVWGHTGRGSERLRQRRPPPLLPQLGAGGPELRGAGPGSALCQWEPQPQGAGGHRCGHRWGRAQGAGCDLTRPLLVGGQRRPDSPSCRLAHSSAAPTEAFLLVFVRAGPRQRRARRASWARRGQECVRGLPPALPLRHVAASLLAYGSPGDTPVGGQEQRLVGSEQAPVWGGVRPYM